MQTLTKLFENNKTWVKEITEKTPDFFKQLSEKQSPEYLWIGCSDSRVPANQIVDLLPGEIFVHRNIANLVVHTDFNCLSVIQYAVDVLKVRHIIVCGHYGCGGIKAALDGKEHGLIDNWLRHIKDIYRFYQQEIEALPDDEEKCRLLSEKNVLEQVANVCHTTIVQKAWRAGQELTVHGWIYSIDDGLLKDLDACISGLEQIQSIHHLNT
ncbi:MAG TPA: carbonate dehydratase [Gammaproteobacteria bacterium]|nr:carbonate dehydratase [Candidatus Parabeggiatoa sp.]HAI68556.1 carbonate dehydratase [Gammaproteobacteria bacterium]